MGRLQCFTRYIQYMSSQGGIVEGAQNESVAVLHKIHSVHEFTWSARTCAHVLDVICVNNWIN